MALKIKCAECIFVRADKNAIIKKRMYYECGNADSDYYLSLLNVTPQGIRQESIG